MADYEYIVSSGVIVTDTASIRDEVEAEFKAALGDDLVTTPDTPEGVLITAEVLARDAVVRNNATLANQINPNIAGGTFFDAVWALTGGERVKSTRSTAVCTVTGVNGTIISTSVRFKSVAGDIWAVVDAVTIGVSGSAAVNVRAIEYGPIAAPPAAINQIFVGTLGLETVTNTLAAILGLLTQSDQSARGLRKKTLAIQGVSLPESITSAVYYTEGVKSLKFRENFTGATVVIDGVTMVEHSIYACVDGGSDQDVALALLKKSVGCNFNSFNTPVPPFALPVNVTDPTSGQIYAVRFDRPILVPVLIRVTVRVTNPLIDPQVAVRETLLRYAAGEIEGEDGFVVGGNVSAFELAGAINSQYPNIFVQNLEIALAPSGTFSNAEIPIAIFKKATTNDAAITVIVI